MARIPLNFQEIEERQFPVYPPGVYTLRIVELKMETSKSSGELKETVTFEIVNGPGAEGPSPAADHAGKKLITSYSLQQKAGFRFMRLLAACGIPKEQMSDVDDQQLVGCVIRATVATENYQGRATNRVQNEDPLNGPAGNVAPAGAPLPQAPFAGGAPGMAPQGFTPPAGPAAPTPGAPPQAGQWAQWGPPPANGGPAVPQGFAGAAPTPPPAKPVG